MEMNLSPQFPDVTVFEGEGGGYYTWSASQSPILGEAKIGAGKLLLHPHGFALPHYADCYKIGYVVRGSCRVGVVLPNRNSPREEVLGIKKGDAIPVPIGAVSWWYNACEDSDVEIIFLGETTQTYTPAQFDYFFLTGALGVLGGFSTEFVSRAFDLTKTESDQLTKSQTGALIVKLPEGQTPLPHPSEDANKKMVFNLETAKPSIKVNHGGSLTIATAENFPFLKKGLLSASFVSLDPNSMISPTYTADSSIQLIHATKGSGIVQIAGLNGKNALEAKVSSGQLFVVPKFFAAAVVADGEGLEYFSVVTSSELSFVQLAGVESVYKAMSPSVLQAALNVDPEFLKLFNSKLSKGTIFVPPKN